jgi:putative ABC transport system permease protein
LGIDERWLVVQVLLEGLIVALIGSVAGSVLGLWTADWLGQLALGGTASELLDVTGGTALAWAAGKALVFGPLVGCGSMWLAYRSVFGKVRKRRYGLPVGCAVLFGCGAFVPATGIVGAFLAIAAAALTAALLVGPALVLWAQAPPGNASLVALLNRRNLAHRSADVRVALGGLVIALATAIGMSLMVFNFRVAFEAMLDQRLSADVYVESRIGFSDADLAELRSIVGPGSTIRVERRERGWMRNVDSDDAASGADRLAASFIYDAGAADALRRYGFAGPMPADGALLNEPGSRLQEVTPGDVIEVSGAQGTARLTVAGIFRDYGASFSRVVLAPDTGAAIFGKTLPRAVAVSEMDAEQADALFRYAEQNQWRARSDADVRSLALTIFDRAFRLSDALVVLATAVAGIGLFNALVAVRLRRASEFRLLHSMGFSVGEFLRLNLWHAGMLGVHAVLVALPLGLGIGWLLCGVLNPRAFGWSIPFSVSGAALILPIGLGLVGVMLAGTLPALRTIVRGDFVDA